MKINHIAVWCKDLEKQKDFYKKYFNGITHTKYNNSKKGFSSYFIHFESDTTLELMQSNNCFETDLNSEINYFGISHLAFSVGSKLKVDELTKILAEDGFKIIDGPRTTGDGYYESVFLDPEGNKIELTI